MKRKRHSPQQVVRKLQEAQAAIAAISSFDPKSSAYSSLRPESGGLQSHPCVTLCPTSRYSQTGRRRVEEIFAGEQETNG